jgi:hypothetical protein
MDTLMRALSGALVARATARHTHFGGGARRCRFFAGAFPDVDVIVSLVSPITAA